MYCVVNVAAIIFMRMPCSLVSVRVIRAREILLTTFSSVSPVMIIRGACCFCGRLGWLVGWCGCLVWVAGVGIWSLWSMWVYVGGQCMWSRRPVWICGPGGRCGYVVSVAGKVTWPVPVVASLSLLYITPIKVSLNIFILRYGYYDF